MLDGIYDSKCDTWSLGVLLYMLLGGALPFDAGGRDSKNIYAKIRRGDYHFEHAEFKVTSQEALDLITNLLKKDPE